MLPLQAQLSDTKVSEQTDVYLGNTLKEPLLRYSVLQSGAVNWVKTFKERKRVVHPL